MKNLITTFVLLTVFSCTCLAQIWQPSIPVYNETYTHLVIYKTLEDRMRMSNGSAWTEKEWETRSVLFSSEEEAFAWLNESSERWFSSIDSAAKQKTVRIDEGNLIGLYDLRTAKEIKLKLKTEKKRQERKVEVITEADEWEDVEFIKQ